MTTFTCPVCGYGMNQPPYDYNICPCCGTEFELNDTSSTLADLRTLWLKSGLRWWSTLDSPPDNWDPYTQISRLLERPVYTAVAGSGLGRMIAGLDQQDYASGGLLETAGMSKVA
jgi:hypothetical protein